MSEKTGLWSSQGNPVPLTGVRVEAQVLGRGAKVRVFQNFMNREEKPLEAVYKFPLPEGSAVCGFKARIDGSVIEGRVEERDKAFELYDDALSKGDGGYLLDEERPNIFIKGVARAGRGASEFIYPGERIEPKMLRLFGKTASQGITDFSVDWAGMKAEQAPAAPTLFLDTPTTLFAKLDGEPDLTRTIRVKGKIGGLEKIWEIDPVAAENQGLPVRLLWARDRIRDLEESEGGVDARGSRQKERKRDKAKETIIDLSKEYGLLSRLTSFVAIEERQEKDKVTGEAVLRKVPVLVTTGWHGRGNVFGTRVLSCLPQTKLHIRLASMSLIEKEPQLILESLGLEASSYSLKTPWDISKLEARGDLDVVLLILSRQKAGGGIELDVAVSRALGLDLDEIEKTADLIKGSLRVNRFLLLSTAILLSVLELRFASERSTWEGAVKKSRDWLDGIMKRGEPKVLGVPLTEWARAYAARGK